MTKEKLEKLINANRTLKELDGIIRELEHGADIHIECSFWIANISDADCKQIILKALKDIYDECNKIIEEA